MTSNAFSVGRTIIVTRGMLDCDHRQYIEAVLAHELGHVYHYDSWIKALLEISIMAVIGIISLTLFGITLIITLFATAIISIISSVLFGFIIGAYISKLLQSFFVFL